MTSNIETRDERRVQELERTVHRITDMLVRFADRPDAMRAAAAALRSEQKQKTTGPQRV
jgi:hypothetical protein